MHGAALGALAGFEGVDPVEPHAPGAGVVAAVTGLGAGVGVPVGQRRRVAAGVPFLAVHRAGMAADADVEVDDAHQLTGARPRLRKRARSEVTLSPTPTLA